ncbi:MAG: radical SAM protein [Methanobacteriaceae archaeon]
MNLSVKNIKIALSDYYAIMTNNQLSRSQIAATIEAENTNNETFLWKEHEHLRKEFNHIYLEQSSITAPKPSFSYLDLKLKIAELMFRYCQICEKSCKIDRRHEKGECGVNEPLIASEFLHLGEEFPLIPSHTIFFSGCNFRCVYCQNWDISQQPRIGISLSEKKLAERIDKRRVEGSRNVNFVGGDPTPNLPYILRTMLLVKENIPVVWNSNMYLSSMATKLLDGFVDLYLTDFKYGNNQCALRFSGISNYMEIVGRNHLIAWQGGDMIIRHLILPNHIECCSKPLLRWIFENIGNKVVINIMGQYNPVYRAMNHPDISQLPLSKEISEVLHYAKDLGFINLI